MTKLLAYNEKCYVVECPIKVMGEKLQINLITEVYMDEPITTVVDAYNYEQFVGGIEIYHGGIECLLSGNGVLVKE